MIKRIKKRQYPLRIEKRQVGVVIDCEEITIAIFPPPREHGRPHCHVIAKKSCKVKSSRSEVFPEVKIFLDGSEVILITEGFSKKDLDIIGSIIFNEPAEGEDSNDEYLQKIWEALHGQSEEN